MDNAKIKEIVTAEMMKKTSLSDIQKLLNEEYNYKMTFLDLRILASELEEVIENIAKEEIAEQEAIDAEAEEDMENSAEEQLAAADGNTVVEISKLARPGAMMHGSVKFASGATAEWILDHTGRLGLDKAVGEPTEDDLKAFQQELQKAIGGQ